METLKKGSIGESVKALQRALNLAADGIFGIVTEEAVKSFQRANGLVADGIVGAKTWEKILHGSTLKKSKRVIKEIIVHCSATREGQNVTVDDITKMHKSRGFNTIGYHYVVYIDGSIHNGRDVDLIGAHCTNHNSYSIGVCYVGGCKKDGKTPKDTRTDAQKKALLSLLKQLKQLYPSAKIIGHRDTSPDKNGNGIIEPFEWIKCCPCFDAKEEYKRI